MTSVFDLIAFSARLFHPSDHDTLAPPGARDLMVPVDPGAAIHVRIHQHAGAAATIVLFHGNGEVVADYDGFVRWYRDAGANLAVVEYRGYGRCDGMPSLRACLRDAMLVLRALRAELGENRIPLVVMGRSLGSFCALEIASSGEPLLDALVIESGIGDLDGFVRRRGYDPATDVTEQDREDFCPLRKARKVRVPTLVLHGECDDLVNPENARMVYEACGSTDKQLMFVPDRGHNDIFLGQPYWPSLSAFVRKLAGSVARAPDP